MAKQPGPGNGSLRERLFRNEPGRKNLVRFFLDLFSGGDLLARVGANPERLGNFLAGLVFAFPEKPIQSLRQIAAVTQRVSSSFSLPILKTAIPEVERFWVLTAAICTGLDFLAPEKSLAQRTLKGPRSLPPLSGFQGNPLRTIRGLMAIPDCDFAATMSDEGKWAGRLLLPGFLAAPEFRDDPVFVRDFAAILGNQPQGPVLADPVLRLFTLKALLKTAFLSVLAFPGVEGGPGEPSVPKDKPLGEPLEKTREGARGHPGKKHQSPFDDLQTLVQEKALLELVELLAKIEPGIGEFAGAKGLRPPVS